jgi:hypothetical protein
MRDYGSIFLVLALAAGCATTNGQNAGRARAGGAGRPAVVLFAAPPRSTLWLYQGVDDGAGWTCDGAAGQPVQVSSEAGFVMAKLPARTGRETYAIGDITMADGSERHLRSGPNAKVPVFNAVPGKVTLVGGVKVLAVGEGVSLLPDPSVTRARAARFLAGKNRRENRRANGRESHRMSATVATGKMSWVAMPDSCERR